MKQYSDLEVYGVIRQYGNQETNNDAVVKYSTLKGYNTPITVSGSSPYDSTIDTYHAGAVVVVNAGAGPTYLCTTDSPSSSSDFVMMGEANVIEHITVGETEVQPTNKTVALGSAAGATIGDQSGNVPALNSNGLLASSMIPPHTSSSGTDYGQASSTYFGHAKASSDTPSMDGTADAGTDNGEYARGDHVHPTDTSRASVAALNAHAQQSASNPPHGIINAGAYNAIGDENSVEDSSSYAEVLVSGQGIAKAIAAAIAGIPSPMQFKGTVGDAGSGGTYTWSTLPSASSSTGWVLKVIDDHTSSSPVCEEGDTIISDGTDWVVIPSGDEPGGTVTQVSAGAGLITDQTSQTTDNAPITSTGEISIRPENLVYHYDGYYDVYGSGSFSIDLDNSSFIPTPPPDTQSYSVQIRHISLFDDVGEVHADIAWNDNDHRCVTVSMITPSSYNSRWYWNITCW